MKKIILGGLAALVLTSGAALAADRHGHGKVTNVERGKIARSAGHLAAVKRRVFADGHVTRFERFQLQRARARHASIIYRAHRW